MQHQKKKKNENKLPILLLSDRSGCSSLVGSDDMCSSSAGDVGEIFVSLPQSACWSTFLPIIFECNHFQCTETAQCKNNERNGRKKAETKRKLKRPNFKRATVKKKINQSNRSFATIYFQLIDNKKKFVVRNFSLFASLSALIDIYNCVYLTRGKKNSQWCKLRIM